jgi:hypothetical protein
MTAKLEVVKMSKYLGKIGKISTVLIIAVVFLAIIPPFVHAQAESITTDYSLYIFQWRLGGVDQSRPYVNVSLTAVNLDRTHTYRIKIWKFGPTPGPRGESQAITAVTSTIVNFTFQDVPQNLAGTYNVTLIDETLAITVAKTNFGVWGLSGPGYNYGQTILVYGGGALNGTDVTIRIYNATRDVTSLLLDSDTTTADEYGWFTFMGKELFSYPKYTGTYNVAITNFTPIVDGRPQQRTLQMLVSRELRVRVHTDKDEYMRTETVKITAEVYHLDWSPVIGGSVNATISFPAVTPRKVTLKRTVGGNYTGDWTIPKDARIGNWTVRVDAAEPPYGNTGTDSKIIKIDVTYLVVTITQQPPTVVNRATVVQMTFTVKYPDGSSATLDLTKCRVVVINATTGTIIAIARLASGYNATWYVPPDAPIGSTYKFLIYKNNLTDNVTPDPNIGPLENVYSDPFAVERAPVSVTVSTYDPATWKPKDVFRKGENVGIRAKVMYYQGPPMASGTVKASIYYPNGSVAAVKAMAWDPAKYDWYVVYNLPAVAPSGTWTVKVDADDGAGNFGSGQTTFFVAGIVLQPSSGTVGPTTTVDNYGVVSGSIYTIGTKSLGTNVQITGLALPPNKAVNITVEITTYNWYFSKYGTYELLVARNVPTDANGAFSAAFKFPTAPAGNYTIRVKIGTLVYESAVFRVVRGILLDPPVMAGPMVVKVIGTGFTPYPNEAIRGILVNGTDAIIGYNLQCFWAVWQGDGNGTLRSNLGDPFNPYYVQPGFTFPVLVTGDYKISLISYAYPTYYKTEDTITVVSELHQLITAIQKLNMTLNSISATLTGISSNIATINTNVGTIKTNVTDLAKTLADMKNVVYTINGTVGYIKTDVGTIKGWASDISYIKGEVAKIQSIKDNTENIPSKIDEIKNLSTPIYIAVILSLIAAIAAIICAILVYRKIA